jgi:hypothetical protein
MGLSEFLAGMSSMRWSALHITADTDLQDDLDTQLTDAKMIYSSLFCSNTLMPKGAICRDFCGGGKLNLCSTKAESLNFNNYKLWIMNYKFELEAIDIKILICLFIFLAGCSTTVVHDRIVVRDTTYVIVPPVIRDSAKAQIWTDTLIRIIKERYNDTVVDIQIQPQTHEVFWKIKPDSIFKTIRDTVYKTETTVTQAPDNSGQLILGIIGAIVILGIILIIIMTLKK